MKKGILKAGNVSQGAYTALSVHIFHVSMIPKNTYFLKSVLLFIITPDYLTSEHFVLL